MNVDTLNRFLRHQLTITHEQNRLLFAHVSDLHVQYQGDYGDERGKNYPSQDFTADQLGRVIDELNTLDPAPNFVIFGGDLTDNGHIGEWERFFTIVQKLKLPYYLTLGNHDHNNYRHKAEYATFNSLRHTFLGDLGGSVLGDVQTYSFKHSGYRFVGLDSRDQGELTEAQHTWLDKLRQEEHDLPLVVSVHRPLLPVGNWVDWHLLRDRPLVEKLTRATGTIAVLSGHAHKSQAWIYRGVRHLINPALAYGIGDGVGYRLVCLANKGVAWSAVRYLHGPSLDQYQRWDYHDSTHMLEQQGRVVLDAPQAFENHPLCHPFMWPYEVNPAKRDLTEGLERRVIPA